MNILVTGAKGFVGKNLIVQLNNIKEGKTKKYSLTSDLTISEYDIDTEPKLLDDFTKKCDFVCHLAGVNRPQKDESFMSGNFGFTSILIESLKKNNNKAPILITSSVQAELDNPYGKSKREGEKLIFNYGEENGIKTYVYRLPNVFGKWCRPNYNSAVATFCHNIANELPIMVNDPDTVVRLAYIDDVIDSVISKIAGEEAFNFKENDKTFESIEPVYEVKLSELTRLLYSFKDSRQNMKAPDVTENSFSKKLYSTYLSYLPKDKFSYPLKMNVDNRGSFTEIIRTEANGQFSVNISKPHITKGQHWHNTKNEKFLVVSGNGVIRFREIDSDEIIEYFVSGEKLEVVDIPTGYTHNIENIGDTDMVTFMWCNECFNPERPDTYFLEV